MSEDYYLRPVENGVFPPEALDEWRKFLAAQPLIVQREDGAYWWFADAVAAEGFRQCNGQHTECADLIALDRDYIEIDASYVHDESTLAVLRDFLRRFKEQWPCELCGLTKDDMTVDEFISEYRVVAG